MLPKGQTQFAVVADCSGFGPSKTPPLPMLKTAFVTMQRHYPMRLGYVVIVNAGGPIILVWKVRIIMVNYLPIPIRPRRQHE